MSVLTNSAEEVVAQLLIDGGVAEANDSDTWPVGVGLEPSNPDDCLTVFGTDPVSDGSEMVTGDEMQHEGIQIRVRSGDYLAGHQKMAAVANFLSAVDKRDVVIGAKTYLVDCLTRTSGPVPLGQDVTNTKRLLFILNLVASVTER